MDTPLAIVILTLARLAVPAVLLLALGTVVERIRASRLRG